MTPAEGGSPRSRGAGRTEWDQSPRRGALARADADGSPKCERSILCCHAFVRGRGAHAAHPRVAGAGACAHSSASFLKHFLHVFYVLFYRVSCATKPSQFYISDGLLDRRVDVRLVVIVVVDAARLGLDVGGPGVLSRYEAWRRFDSMTLLAVTDGLDRLFSNDVGAVRAARGAGLAAVNRMPPLKRFFMRHARGSVGKLPRMLRGTAP